MATHETTGTKRPGKELIPREYLRTIAVWSLIPSYVIAGAFMGWMLDQWLGTFPYVLFVMLIGALGLAVRDMIRLRDEVFGKPSKG